MVFLIINMIFAGFVLIGAFLLPMLSPDAHENFARSLITVGVVGIIVTSVIWYLGGRQ